MSRDFLGFSDYRNRSVDSRSLPRERRHQFGQKRPSAMAKCASVRSVAVVVPIARRLSSDGSARGDHLLLDTGESQNVNRER